MDTDDFLSLDGSIIPYAEAWELHATAVAERRGIPLSDAGKASTAELKAAGIAGKLTWRGYPARDGKPEEVEPEAIAPAKVRSLFIDEIEGQPQHEYIHGQPWRPYGRALLSSYNGPLQWTGLHFERTEFLAWTENTATGQAGALIDSQTSDGRRRTGAPGRPSSMHLIKQQLKQRRLAGITCEKLVSEARALREWLIERHPQEPPPGEKAIKNAIRPEYNAAKEGLK